MSKTTNDQDKRFYLRFNEYIYDKMEKVREKKGNIEITY